MTDTQGMTSESDGASAQSTGRQVLEYMVYRGLYRQAVGYGGADDVLADAELKAIADEKSAAGVPLNDAEILNRNLQIVDGNLRTVLPSGPFLRDIELRDYAGGHLQPPTRLTRRNLAAVSALGFLFGLNGNAPTQFFGTTLAHPWVVAVSLIGLIGYEGIQFHHSVSHDRALSKQSCARAARSYVEAEAALEAVRSRMALLTGDAVLPIVRGWCEQLETEIAIYRKRLKAASRRAFIDLSLPICLGIVAFVLLVILLAFGPLPWASKHETRDGVATTTMTDAAPAEGGRDTRATEGP